VICTTSCGATGIYAAVELQDAGLKLQIIDEQRDHLGGHTYTYQDSVFGGRTEAAVVVFSATMHLLSG